MKSQIIRDHNNYIKQVDEKVNQQVGDMKEHYDQKINDLEIQSQNILQFSKIVYGMKKSLEYPALTGYENKKNSF